jgi:hypothetical protein
VEVSGHVGDYLGKSYSLNNQNLTRMSVVTTARVVRNINRLRRAYVALDTGEESNNFGDCQCVHCQGSRFS